MSDRKSKFIIDGGRHLKGTIRVSGSKNAALPILCAALLAKSKSTIKNIPDIADIHTLLTIFNFLNVKTKFSNNIVEIDPTNIKYKSIPEELICSMRASILLIGPLLAHFKEASIPFPGGCVLGRRPVYAHTHALNKLGAEIIDSEKHLHLTAREFKTATITMPEISVTATENALMLASVIKGKTQIRLAAAEPHVQDLCKFLNSMGAKITGIGTHYLQVEGTAELTGAEYEITGDYLEAGTFAIAGLLTKGEIEIEGIDPGQLDSFWQKLDEAGANYELQNNKIIIKKTERLNAVSTLRTAVYPSFPTDLQAPFAVLLTKAEGKSRIFETLFEGRLNYLFELEKMGAKVEVQNPHQAIIIGPSHLVGVPISSLDLRAGAAMVLAALCADGTTQISNINYIDRGYEKFDQKLSRLGASIQRVIE
jgi:UDP-N-acetylglucosamine 1-carboxyvinyltransferase